MKKTILDSLNRGLLDALGGDEKVCLLGEDILDPYGGAFKVTRGCSSAYPQRVIPTPISEAGLAGMAAGMALRGMRPVLEVMFGDFVTLMADQLINHISKFRWMYNGSVSVPLLIRTPMGGRRGYGPTHSQSLEKLFLGVPGLTVVAPAGFSLPEFGYSAGEQLRRLILESDSPILFIENKLQYLLPELTREDLSEFEVEVKYESSDPEHRFPVFIVRIKGAPRAHVTLAAYGYMSELASQAQFRLAYEEEIFTDLVVPTRLSPYWVTPLIEAANHSGKILLVEEGTLTSGWGAEAAARVAEATGSRGVVIKRIAAKETPVPAATSLEQKMLPQLDDLMAAVRKMSKHND